MKKPSCSARSVVPALGLTLACAACSTTGTAVGKLEEPTGSAESVTLVWKSDASDPDRGTISGTLPDGAHYSGRYFEVLETAPEPIYVDAWQGWPRYWSSWSEGSKVGPVHVVDWPGFVDIYTGRVIANMKSDADGSRMRCRFQINEPLAGLSHGGHGECQLANGRAIEDVVVKRS